MRLHGASAPGRNVLLRSTAALSDSAARQRMPSVGGEPGLHPPGLPNPRGRLETHFPGPPPIECGRRSRRPPLHDTHGGATSPEANPVATKQLPG